MLDHTVKAKSIARMLVRLLVADVRGTRVLTPAVKLLNENPTLVALGKKSEKTCRRSIYDFPLRPRAADDLLLRKIITFSPRKPENLDKSAWFSYIFPTFSTVVYRNLLRGCLSGPPREARLDPGN